jgi:hypothetical protein
LRKAFKKDTSLINDINELTEYKKEDSALVYFEKVNQLVENVLRHKLDKESLTKYFLVHCLDDKETKKEIQLREATEVGKIKSIIKKMDDIKADSGVAAFKKNTYATAVKSVNNSGGNNNCRYTNSYNTNMNTRNVNVNNNRNVNNNIRNNVNNNMNMNNYNKGNGNNNYNNNLNRGNGSNNFKTSGFGNNGNMDNRTCYNCQKIGHISRDCKERKAIKCYGCGKLGHIIRECGENQNRGISKCFGCQEMGHRRNECPNIQCRKCNRNGHFSHQCKNGNGNRTGYYNMNRGHVAAVDQEEYEQNENNYPNEEAPLRDEVIGAMI